VNKGFGACLWISVEEDDSWDPHRDLPPNSAGLSPPCSPLQQVAHDTVFRMRVRVDLALLDPHWYLDPHWQYGFGCGRYAISKIR
jgi:hypothetical protein